MGADTLDLTREHRDLYRPRATPAVVDVPEFRFLMVDGEGDPNTAAQYRDALSALYSVAYTARFALKKAGIIDYRVMPLEGLWRVAEGVDFVTAPKADWRWTMMIRQPPEVTDDVVAAARVTAATKAPPAALKRLRLETFHEGRAAQVMHRGPYAEEAPVIAALHAFIAAQGLRLRGDHHEIYLSDPNRSAPANMRTILRQPVVDT